MFVSPGTKKESLKFLEDARSFSQFKSSEYKKGILFKLYGRIFFEFRNSSKEYDQIRNSEMKKNFLSLIFTKNVFEFGFLE